MYWLIDYKFRNFLRALGGWGWYIVPFPMMKINLFRENSKNPWKLKKQKYRFTARSLYQLSIWYFKIESLNVCSCTCRTMLQGYKFNIFPPNFQQVSFFHLFQSLYREGLTYGYSHLDLHGLIQMIALYRRPILTQCFQYSEVK